MNLVRTPAHGPGWNIKVNTEELRKIAQGNEEILGLIVKKALIRVSKLDEAK